MLCESPAKNLEEKEEGMISQQVRAYQRMQKKNSWRLQMRSLRGN